MNTTAADPLIGQVLSGRYLVRSHVARGGMATVYAGQDTKLDRTVALKVMHAGLAGDQEFVRRFIGEAKHAAALSHPNVVAVYDQGTDNGQVFLVMEYVPGRTVRALLTERGRLGPREALEVMQPVLAALGAAHRAGLVHRDVKPENVLLTEDGQVKVADFGLARAETASRQTRTGMIIGTVGYLAPEQVLTGQADARTDVYAAGIMLFELLTGHQPYQAGSPLAVAYRHVNDVVPPPSSRAPGLPPRLDALVAAATDRDPARRPPDADRFHAAVAEVYNALPPEPTTRNLTATTPAPGAGSYGATQRLNPHTMAIPAHEVPAPPALRERLTRPPGLYGLLAACAILVLVLAGVVVQTTGDTMRVPRLVGLSEADARLQAGRQGLKVRIGSARYDAGVPKDKVAEVRPAAGMQVKKGAVLTLILSKGNRPVTIPDVANQQLDQARQRLRQAGLRPGEEVRKASATVPGGHVITTLPPAGKRQDPADPVTIVVSSGITMPDLTGLTREQAAQKLAGLGLNVHWQQQDPAGGQPPNTVTGQNPPAGQPVSRGDNVQVTVTKSKNKGHCRRWDLFCKKGHGGGQNEG